MWRQFWEKISRFENAGYYEQILLKYKLGEAAPKLIKNFLFFLSNCN